MCPSGIHPFDGCCHTPCPDESEGISDFEDVDGSSGFYAPSPTTESRRLLKKPRRELSLDTPANPAEVLAREEYNHIFPQTSAGLRTQRSFAKAKVLLDMLTKYKKGEDERWVCVELTHKVTQHVL